MHGFMPRRTVSVPGSQGPRVPGSHGPRVPGSQGPKSPDWTVRRTGRSHLNGTRGGLLCAMPDWRAHSAGLEITPDWIRWLPRRTEKFAGLPDWRPRTGAGLASTNQFYKIALIAFILWDCVYGFAKRPEINENRTRHQRTEQLARHLPYLVVINLPPRPGNGFHATV